MPKSLILSKIIRVWILLSNPPDSLVRALQKTVFQFVCNRNQDRIIRKVTVRTTAKGGLGISNMASDINALKLSRIRKLKTSDHKRKDIIKTSNSKMLLLEQLLSNLPTQQ